MVRPFLVRKTAMTSFLEIRDPERNDGAAAYSGQRPRRSSTLLAGAGQDFHSSCRVEQSFLGLPTLQSNFGR